VIERKRLICGTHGERYATFVCRHLVRGAGLGFVEPNRSPASDDESDEQCAWCLECETVRRHQGGWNDISEKFAGVTFICDACFDASRKRNERAAAESE